ncbi:4-hydroxybutyrate dehydrogenase [Anaeromicropila populeti]|uniref:4-hydroxybutyrate dehydrogenase n=1 Tax=Anaeromicropila populeti TaxID=37658 RepID=A0A1I6LNV2_9FIRM|nr:4-hydroxybutyrate dehydrogenase [Anaeromicropila populeti]SFS05101.1 4-hydroxybutyrate dehydrogenase [Anaeromicropila populeti]
MKQFSVVPTIVQFEECKQFCEEFQIGKGDLLFMSKSSYSFFEPYVKEAVVIFRGNYGSGEPSDEMVEKIYQDIKDIPYERVIAIGGGSVLDVAKLFALKQFSPVIDLFDRKIELQKEKKLILVPTTCGTGSEVTNISILELKVRNTKMGLAVEELFADYAVLIPELLNDLSMHFFATSSIDALIHSIESYTSPKANEFTQMFSLKAIQMILSGYKEIAKNGEEARKPLLGDFLMASTYAGIAFGNAGCAAVHAMSYPLGAAYHVAHGEANYAIFTQVYKTYQEMNPNGRIKVLNEFLAEILECDANEVYVEIETLLNQILPKKPLHEYGVTEEDLITFTETVMTKQTRLMNNNYIELSEEKVLGIYKALY